VLPKKRIESGGKQSATNDTRTFQKTSVGVNAQDVEAVLPKAVTTTLFQAGSGIAFSTGFRVGRSASLLCRIGS